MTLLLVDDNREFIEGLAELLRGPQCGVEVALSARQCLEKIKRMKPDAVFLDIGLPDMNGYDLACRLRQIPGLESVPFISISGYEHHLPDVIARQKFFIRNLVKPVKIEQVEKIISELSLPRTGF
jgi:two-component system, sensor histidine kinase